MGLNEFSGASMRICNRFEISPVRGAKLSPCFSNNEKRRKTRKLAPNIKLHFRNRRKTLNLMYECNVYGCIIEKLLI